MPAVYAHNKFGEKVLRKLDAPLKNIIRKYPDQYRIGLQGPDFLFFYKPFEKTSANQLGYQIHGETASTFLKRALAVIEQRGIDSPSYAYLLGFICHFMLDSECHPFVTSETERTGVGHVEIESEFEKMLLKRDGKEPLSYPMGWLIPKDRRTAWCMAPFYRGLSPQIAWKALKGMHFYKCVLTAPNPFKRGLIRMIMKLSGHYEGMQGHLLRPGSNPRCRRSSQGLLIRMERAVGPTAEIIKDFHRTVTQGKALNARFHRTFE